mmetsp:Transcript_51910/g.133846  ORF Transcript_51910/g.133846 Transcript_51910/m.133846 type:complete len:214 (-) Transcript_51910:1111-1752(-)
MHVMAVAPRVVIEHRGRTLLVDSGLGPAPQDDGDAALAVLLLFWQCVDAVLPHNVGVAAEEEEHAVCLWEVQHLARLRVPERELARGAEGDAYRAVLVLRTLRVEGRRVVVKWLPIGAIAVPVEASPTVPLRDVEEICALVQDRLEGLRAHRVLTEQMGTFVPGDPLRLPLAPRLHLAHLLDELIVDVPVVMPAEELGHDNDIVVPDRALELE